MLAAAEQFKKSGDLLASYVYDNVTGLKMFGKVAFYVKDKDGKVTAFMRKPDAEKFMSEMGGELMGAYTPAGMTAKSVKLAVNQ
jgi:NitT/TauT family transport system substrate-binding protein